MRWPSSRQRAAGLANVRFGDYVPDERLVELLATGDIHVVPLRRGLAKVSVPSKTYSILAAGRPVVAAIDPGTEVPRMLAESGGGVSVAPDDADAFTAAIAGARGRPGRRRARWASGPAGGSSLPPHRPPSPRRTRRSCAACTRRGPPSTGGKVPPMLPPPSPRGLPEAPSRRPLVNRASEKQRAGLAVLLVALVALLGLVALVWWVNEQDNDDDPWRPRSRPAASPGRRPDLGRRGFGRPPASIPPSWLHHHRRPGRPRLAQKGKGKRVRFQGGTLFPMVVAIVLVLGLALIVYARTSRPAADASAPQIYRGQDPATGQTIGDHWHGAYGFQICSDTPERPVGGRPRGARHRRADCVEPGHQRPASTATTTA